jgi:hypothetical protein
VRDGAVAKKEVVFGSRSLVAWRAARVCEFALKSSRSVISTRSKRCDKTFFDHQSGIKSAQMTEGFRKKLHESEIKREKYVQLHGSKFECDTAATEDNYTSQYTMRALRDV